ncbi:MAG TPA: class IV adenylate cyclase [Anaerolineae bacterium]|nr:class IV adenylate cyclase [Anaerolineae bacterium]
MMSNSDLEFEAKFFVGKNLAAVRARLLENGATLHKERVFERNVRYENQWDGLYRKGQLLRLRQDSQAKLTFKGPAKEDITSEVKVREELEVVVSDFDTMDTILRRIGFRPVQVYEKYRETFSFNTIEVVLDEMPYGAFVELEGNETTIKSSAITLGLDWDTRLITNYLAIMAQVKQAYNLDFDDLTFANFTDWNGDLATLLATA